jgi:LacI family transcriptional regulator
VVSYVLNDGPRPVSERARARVLAAIDELDYRPNAVARALRLRRTRTLGVVVPDISNAYFGELAKELQDAAFAAGYSLLLANSSDDPERERAELATLLDRQVDGLILIGVGPASLQDVTRRVTIPLVALDRADGTTRAPTVTVDNRAGARLGVDHLISHGHRAIACIGGPAVLAAAQARVAGWRAALGVPGAARPEWLVSAKFSRAGGYDAARALLELTPRPSAIFASSDLQGIGALRACHEAALCVPDDMAIVAFDGTQEAEFTIPGLTVVQQPIRQIARRAVEIVVTPSAGDAPHVRPGRPHTVMQATLVLRESCGCPRSARDGDR